MVKELFLNYGLNALRVLGIKTYLYYIFVSLLSIPRIICERKITAVDKLMNNKMHISINGFRFLIDGQYCDQNIKEDSYTFGLVREIYIKNVYFKHHNIDYKTLKNVVDLGGNRGLFSLLAANFCQKIIFVEVLDKYNDVFWHNMQINSFDNYAIENIFIGRGGLLDHLEAKTKTLEKLMQDHSLDTIDFLKIDIEGSEFAFFADNPPLDKIKHISMEIHQEYGDVSKIMDKLSRSGFNIMAGNEDLQVTDQINQIAYIYAVNRNLTDVC